MHYRFKSSVILVIFIFSIFVADTALPAEISISRIGNVKSGERHTVSVLADDIASEISGFNLLISHEQSKGMVLNVRAGDLHKDYGWEYFTYRQLSRDTVESFMPGFNTSLLNIVGVASLTGGSPMTVSSSEVALARFDVILPLVIGSFSDEVWSPFSFFWRDCDDNVLTSLNRDTVYTANGLFQHFNISDPHEPVNYTYPGFGFPDQICSSPEGKEIAQSIDFVNSGILFFVYDPVEECLNGDINQNGIPYELADLILLIDYFTIGILALPEPIELSIAQSDCNCDSIVLSVADVVCFVRRIIRDPRIHKIPVSGGYQSQLAFENDGHSTSLNLNSESDIALVYLRIDSDDFEKLNINPSLAEARTGRIGDTTTMILVNMDGQSVFSPGEHQLFAFPGNIEIELNAWVVDMNGNETAYKLDNQLLPESPILLQNYPNPFNPSTTIEFSLPTYSEWTVEIYNVTGQMIRTFNGSAVGKVELEWDGTSLNNTDVASGVYFYKLITSDQTLSRKMLLLK